MAQLLQGIRAKRTPDAIYRSHRNIFRVHDCFKARISLNYKGIWDSECLPWPFDESRVILVLLLRPAPPRRCSAPKKAQTNVKQTKTTPEPKQPTAPSKRQPQLGTPPESAEGLPRAVRGAAGVRPRVGQARMPGGSFGRLSASRPSCLTVYDRRAPLCASQDSQERKRVGQGAAPRRAAHIRSLLESHLPSSLRPLRVRMRVLEALYIPSKPCGYNVWMPYK